MSRLKSLFAVLFLAAIAVATPAAYATDGTPIIHTMIAGSSAMWTTMALGAYNAGAGITGTIGLTLPMHHFVSSGNFNLVDTRPAGGPLTDTGAIWIVWDSHVDTAGRSAPNVWAFIKVDSVVGTRCYFGKCFIESGTFTDDAGASISNALWGDASVGVAPPTVVQNLFASTHRTDKLPPNQVNVGATDIRPEDGLYATARAITALGGGTDGLEGLGYNQAGHNTTSGTPSWFGYPTNQNTICPGGTGPSTLTDADLVGNPILGDYTAGSHAYIVAFALFGKDPFNCKATPGFLSISVGASPVTFLASESNLGIPTGALTNATPHQLGLVFSGTNMNASVFGLPAAPIAAYLREPLSGTMNTTEYTVFRLPSAFARERLSQEAGIGLNNPIGGLAGNRWRAIGTGDEVKSVRDGYLTPVGGVKHGLDGLGYTFFSYGNVSNVRRSLGLPIRYLQLNSVDPIFEDYAGTEPGQPGNGLVPGKEDLPAACASAFPCNENQIWTHGLSFPNVRNGAYKAWSVLRLLALAKSADAKNLVATSNKYAVTTVPDYVPFAPITVGAQTDPGLTVLRSHYNCTTDFCGANPVTGAALAAINFPVEKGRDAGGAILPTGDRVINWTNDSPAGLVLFH